MPTPRPTISLSLTRAEALYRLALLTQDRTNPEQEALLTLAAHLDAAKPRKGGPRRVWEVESTRDTDA